jgi:hypothetical protein
LPELSDVYHAMLSCKALHEPFVFHGNVVISSVAPNSLLALSRLHYASNTSPSKTAKPQVEDDEASQVKNDEVSFRNGILSDEQAAELRKLKVTLRGFLQTYCYSTECSSPKFLDSLLPLGPKHKVFQAACHLFHLDLLLPVYQWNLAIQPSKPDPDVRTSLQGMRRLRLLTRSCFEPQSSELPDAARLFLKERTREELIQMKFLVIRTRHRWSRTLWTKETR